MKQQIITEDTPRRIQQNPYRVAPKEREEIQEQVNKMHEHTVIQASKSRWASPVVMVKKNDGSRRFCVDYRRLKRVSKEDVYPLSRIGDSLDGPRHARYFSSVDLMSGYWQIKVEEWDRERTAFVKPEELYDFKVLSFGLWSAPGTVQLLMDAALSGVADMCSTPRRCSFLRNVRGTPRTAAGGFIKTILSTGVTLKAGMCRFGFEELQLSHAVSHEDVRRDPDKITAVTKFPAPTENKAVSRLLSLWAC